MKLLSVWLTAVLLLECVYGARVLVLLDDRNTKTTHSRLLKELQLRHQVKVAYTFGQQSIELMTNDERLYDTVIALSSSQNDTESKVKAKELLQYFDSGANLVLVGDVDTSINYRRIFNGFGTDLLDSGTIMRDHFSKGESADELVTRNYFCQAPFFLGCGTPKPLIFRGTGMLLVNYVNHQLWPLIHPQPTAFALNLRSKFQEKSNQAVALVAAVQGSNNARALLTASMYAWSDAAWSQQNYANAQIFTQLLKWVEGSVGQLRIASTYFHAVGEEGKQILFSVGQQIQFQAQIQEYKDGNWRPYTADDLQVEFVMLDPWVRSLLSYKQHKHVASFFAPQKEGIYQFKIDYRRPGYTFLKSAERVTVRPYRHDQFERMLPAAAPYTLGTLLTVFATFLFVLLFLYSSPRKHSKSN